MKCVLYCNSQPYTHGRLPILKVNTTHNIQMILSVTNSTCMIEQLPISSPFKHLGIDKPSLGNQRKQIKTLINYALWGARIFSSGNIIYFQFELYLNTHLLQILMSLLSCSQPFTSSISFQSKAIYSFSYLFHGLQSCVANINQIL